jgi:hypothetical protein
VRLPPQADLQLKRAQEWTPGRGAAALLLVAGPVLGACLGAVLHRPPAFPERAQALVVANHASALGGRPAQRVRALAAVLESRPVATAVKLEAGTAEGSVPLSGSLSAESNARAGLVTVTANAENGSAARTLANAASSYAVMLAGRVQAAANAPYSIPASDFSYGIGAWDGNSQFALRPTSLTVAPNGGRFRDGSLRAVCAPVPGCGPSTTLSYVVAPHDIYTGAVWARARSQPFPAVAFLGGDAHDVETGARVTLTRAWRRLAVSWAPLRSHSTIELGLLTTSHRSASFVVDAASLTEGPAPPGVAQEQRLAADEAAAVAFPARVTGAVAGDTALSAALGALAGLLAAMAGCTAGAVARRRQSGA